MNNELKYPIKYAILELKVGGGWLVGYKDITQVFIVSKCYVVGSEIKYYANGKNKIVHKVVFPFSNISNFKLSLQRGIPYNDEEIIPSYDVSGNPYPVDVVSSLFASYEEAKEIAFLKNEELKSKLKFFEDDNWEEDLNICYKFEKLILNKTNHMHPIDNEVEISCKKLQKSKI